ncbi:hypothetical protein F2Q69_00026479 [Brassica cretica]|uniref:DUF223 domain-containing protein n=1 Tax=Brassica cretica TaxID=69181 RepID=A0A8S9RY14_BRACR|nr:hypothetical protein F2Q69_00026479 [Brassica cretica]
MILIFDEPNLHLLENVSLCLSSFSNRRPGVRHSTFESLRLGRSSQSIAFGFLRFWDSLNFNKDKEFVGITVLFLDEKVNSVIYGFTPVRRANHYMPSLKEGSIVKVDHFEVARPRFDIFYKVPKMGLGCVIKTINPLIEIAVSYLKMVFASNYVRLTINHQNDGQTLG